MLTLSMTSDIDDLVRSELISVVVELLDGSAKREEGRKGQHVRQLEDAEETHLAKFFHLLVDLSSNPKLSFKASYPVALKVGEDWIKKPGTTL